MPLPTNFDKHGPLGRVAIDANMPMRDLVRTLLADFATDTTRQFDQGRTALGRVVDVEPHARSTELLGPLETPPAIPAPENAALDALQFAAAISAPEYTVYGSATPLSVQRATAMSWATLRRFCLATADHALSGIEESLADALNGLSLSASQVATSVAEAFSEFSALETPAGGYAPRVGAALIDASLRGRAADENWSGWGIPLHFARLGTSGRFYLLPATDQGVVVMAIMPGLSLRGRDDINAGAGWRIDAHALANEAPSIRSGFVVRGTL